VETNLRSGLSLARAVWSTPYPYHSPQKHAESCDEDDKFPELAIPLNLMAAVLRALKKLIGTTSLLNLHTPQNTRFDFSHFAGRSLTRVFRGSSSQKIIAEGDRVYVNGKRPKFSKLLQQGGKLDLPDGFISHDEIIGARPSQIFKTNKGKPYRISFPNLDMYISSMPRKVTPVRG
jgi:hypothetical protein